MTSHASTAAPNFKSRIFAYGTMYALWIVLIFLVTGGPRQPSSWLDSWTQWDAHWYRRIWQEGYPASDPRALVFPPGYSILIGSLSSVLPLSFTTTALFVNLAAFFSALVLAAEFLYRKLKTPPFWNFALTLSFPASYFVFTSYSDSVFFLLLWLAFTLAEQSGRRARVLEVTSLFLAPWLRLTGLAFASWLLLKRWTALAVLVSLTGWLGLNALIAGDPLYFLKAQKLFLMPEGNFLDGVTYTFTHLWPMRWPGEVGWIDYFQFQLLPALYLVLLTASTAWLWKKNERTLALTGLAILLMSHNQSMWRSAVRYDWPLMPMLYATILCLSARAASGAAQARLTRLLLLATAALQLALQIIFAGLFRMGHWAF